MTEPYHGFIPYLFYDNVAAAIEWYRRVFGFEEIGRWEDGTGNIQNAEMRVGSTELWLDGSGRRNDQDDRPNWIGVWVDDVDEIYRKVRSAGIECDPPVDREFGVRMLNVPDDMGYLWGFVRRL